MAAPKVADRTRPRVADRERARVVVREVRRRGPGVNQATLRTELAMPKETMGRPVRALVDGGVLVGTNNGLSLRPDLGLLVGVDITHSKARIAISDLGYEHARLARS